MTASSVDATLTLANPLTNEAAAGLRLQGAEADLIRRIVEIPVGPSRRRSSVHARRRRLALVLAATAAVAAGLALLPVGGQTGEPSTAFGAALVRFANASPLVLLRLPGWHVVYADEQVGGFGEMHFVRGPADANGTPRGASFANEVSLAGQVAQLTWTPGAWSLGGHQSAATGLGVTAHRFIYEGGTGKAIDISAMFVYHGRVLEFRATVKNMAMFRAELRALKSVGRDTWLRAMPPSVITTADSAATVRAMLKGIPLPPGFDPSRIRGVRLIHDRYQLGAAVTGTIACMWIAEWNRGRIRGDHAMVKRAIAAMATTPRWPILRQMAPEGGWTQSLIGIAHAMPSGMIEQGSRVPLISMVGSGLGCSIEWDVKLG